MSESVSEQRDLFVQNPDVTLREEDPDGALLFNPDTNQIRVINSTGLFIWKRCDGKHDLHGLVTAMKDAFEGVPEKEVTEQVTVFIEDMKANGFIGLPQSGEPTP